MRDHIHEAYTHARRAYEFSPGAYTFASMAATLHAIKAYEAQRKSWIDAYTEYNGGG